MKTLRMVLFLVLPLFLFSCSAQLKLASRLSGEWAIEEFEVINADGSTSRMENAGTITFMANGRGTQTFSSTIAHLDAVNTGDFRWTNTSETVSITGKDSSYPKAWIIMSSKRNTQHWRSTDGQGNVQVMKLRKK